MISCYVNILCSFVLFISENCLLHIKSATMYRREYHLSVAKCHQNAVGTYRKHVNPNELDEDGRNAVHLSVLLTVHESNVDDSAAVIAALDQVCSSVYCVHVVYHLEVTRNFQLLLKTDSCCECWTLSHAVCKKVNVFLRRLRTILGVKVSNETVCSHCTVPMSLAQLVFSAGLVMLYATMNSSSTKSCSHVHASRLQKMCRSSPNFSSRLG